MSQTEKGPFDHTYKLFSVADVVLCNPGYRSIVSPV